MEQDAEGQETRVERECVYDSGSYYVYRYTSQSREALVEEVDRAIGKIDPMRSPHHGGLHRYMTRWAIEVSYYGLD